MSLANFFNPAPAIRPQFNVGCVFDIATGMYISGEHGEHILNGGVPHITGISGRGETGKSLIADYFFLCVLDRYNADGVVYDTEQTKTRQRMLTLCIRFELLRRIDPFDAERLIISDASTSPGDAFFTSLKDFLYDKKKTNKGKLKTTPFILKEDPIKIISPTAGMIDSFSQWTPSTVMTMQDKNDVGSSDRNTEAMKAGNARSQLMTELPTLTAATGCYMFLTAHLGDEIVMDPHAPSKKKLSFLKGEQKMKRVPENYTFLTNNLWLTTKMSVLKKSGSKELEYPVGLAGESEGNTDLSIIDLQLLRSKSPSAGRVFQIIVSRSEGVLPHLTQFHHIKEGGRWGLGGNVQNYYLELLPDVSLSRTTVRNKIDELPMLRRALEITSEMLQIKELWNIPKELMCTPKELYDDIKKLGYDWDILLGHTRGYWIFKEDETPETPYFLSTMDLLRMRVGQYRPWWYDDAVRKLSKEGKQSKKS